MKDFFKRWFEGTKKQASSPLGQLEAQLIINSFIVVGLFAGTIQRQLQGDGVLAFIFFAFGLLTCFQVRNLWKQYVVLKGALKSVGGW